MEFYFFCPIKEQGFCSADWRNKGELQVIKDEKGRRLEGLIEVICPLCGRMHQFAPEQVACSLTAP